MTEEIMQVIEKWVNPATVTAILSILSTIILFFKNYSLHKKDRNNYIQTINDIEKQIDNNVNETIKDVLSEKYEKYLQPLLEKINNNDKILKTFAKILALSQENTANSRVAILELLSEIASFTETEIPEISAIKEKIEQEVEADKQKKIKQQETLQEISKLDIVKEEKKQEVAYE